MQRFIRSISAAVILLTFSLSVFPSETSFFSSKVNIYYPGNESFPEKTIADNPVFFFESCDSSILKIVKVEGGILLNEYSVYMTEPDFSADVSGLYYYQLPVNAVLERGQNYAWFIETKQSPPMRSRVHYFTIACSMTESYSSESIAGILSHLFEGNAALKELGIMGFLPTGIMRINGLESDPEDIIKLINSAKAKGRRITVRIR
ncbi:MAG: hypothetical protein SVK54_05985 [candidate division WOR-3 bacterium]|nr:hypothetical protein [candidate division WOR-3 bacterium]